ncbi:MAG TPA: alpha/beta hydrolase [Thermoanaerobaculia bacterium]|nr:alpha/beta hydrolase [Thermoanaerobaculia bacterium]
MRRDVEIEADGARLRGWLLAPEIQDGAAGPAGPAPTVVMAPGFGGVKEQLLDRYAQVFRAAGIATLAFDHRGFGASDGEPRQEVDPWRQVEDWRHALTFASLQPEVDPARLAVWGTSLAGGLALVVAALDRRVRCAVAQVPEVGGHAGWLRRVQPEMIEAVEHEFAEDRKRRMAGEPPATLPLVAKRPGAPAAIPGREAWDFFSALETAAPLWKNEVTLRSLDLLRGFEPGAYVERIAPTPLLCIAARSDTASPLDLLLAAYERARPPKRLLLLPGGHFEVYTTGFDTAAGAARDWFAEHLGPERPLVV